MNWKQHPAKIWQEIIVDENDRTVATVSSSYRSEAEVLEIVRLLISAPAFREGLEAIAKRVPHKVSREEAADMACEFHAIATKLLERLAIAGEPGEAS